MGRRWIRERNGNIAGKRKGMRWGEGKWMERVRQGREGRQTRKGDELGKEDEFFCF